MWYTTTLLDHTGHEMGGVLNVEFVDSEETILFKKTVESGEVELYGLGPYNPPGVYILAARYERISTRKTTRVTIVKDIAMTHQGESVLIENTGNVDFNDDTTIILKGDSTYLVNKKINLNPGETIEVDLSEEVPLGNYDILLETEENVSIGLTSESLLAGNVLIHDNRPLLKKVSSQLGQVTGFIIGSDGIVSRSSWYGPLLLGAILITIVFYYGRFTLFGLLRRR